MKQSENDTQWSLNKLEEFLANCQTCYNDYDCRSCQVFKIYQQLKSDSPTKE